jgi:response regulator of citrate/malate metabolism
MRVFIVEDDTFKLSQLKSAVLRVEGLVSIDVASSLQDGMTTLSRQEFDLVLLDMALPSHTGDAGSTDIYSQPVGGLDILLFLSMDDRKEKVVILTQYPTVEYNRNHVPLTKLREKLLADEVSNVIDVILFHEDGAWQEQLSACVEACS